MLPFCLMMQILCDFDGTITNQDSIIFLTEKFGAGPRYRANVRKAIKEGRMTVYQAVRQELATVRVSWEKAVESLKSNIFVDPTFEGFVRWTRERGYPLVVVSAGMEPVIKLFIGHLRLPVYAHRLEITSEGWDYRKDESHDKQKMLCAAKQNGSLVHIGDGTSDVAAIPYADLLFAKVGSYLAEYCESNNAFFFPFENFDDIRRVLEKEHLKAR